MAKIRVLVVEDGAAERRLTVSVLSGDPALEVVGTAANGRLALIKVPQVNPDLIVLNVALPEEEGEYAWTALQKAYPFLPVVLYGSPLPRSSEASTGCFPARDGRERAIAIDRLRADLISRIKHVYARFLGVENASSNTIGLPRRPASIGLKRVEIVAIGASTGGPQALSVLLAPLPTTCPVPIVIVQHVLPGFTGLLAQHLGSQLRIAVSQGVANVRLRAGHAWVAPGDHHMELTRTSEGVQLGLHQEAPENSCRPSADVLFRSVAKTYGAGALAVVLTGMGKDALRGCESIREAGGQVLVQDEATSVVWGMPGMVARAGLADQVLPLHELGPEIIRRLRRGRSLSSPG